MSDLKSRVITICMLVGALAMIGLVLSGTLQMSRLPVAQVATKWPGYNGLPRQTTFDSTHQGARDVAEGWFELAELMDRLDRHSKPTRTDDAQKRPGSVPTARR